MEREIPGGLNERAMSSGSFSLSLVSSDKLCKSEHRFERDKALLELEDARTGKQTE